MIQMQMNSINNQVLHSPLIIVNERTQLVSDFQEIPYLRLLLYAILLDYNIIADTPWKLCHRKNDPPQIDPGGSNQLIWGTEIFNPHITFG